MIIVALSAALKQTAAREAIFEKKIKVVRHFNLCT